MACMCGDSQCPSCGPDQGNFRCIICRTWADDGCEHLGEDGHVLPEFQAQADEIVLAQGEADRQPADLEPWWSNEHEGNES